MKYLAEVLFTFRIEVEDDSFAEALDNASSGITLASLNICESDMGDYFPSEVKILGQLDD
jgi:hypothetical protein